MSRLLVSCRAKALLMMGTLLSVPNLLASASPPPSATIDQCHYTDATAAQAAWTPMGATAPPSPATIDGRHALRLPCNFVGTTIERASWDRSIQLDLAACRGIEFDLYCRDSSPVSHFSIYFQSGAGWYHAAFYPEKPGWNAITVDKADTAIEGQPAGWGQVRTIRLSAWRGQDTDTELFLANMRQAGQLGRDSLVVILRGESAAQAQPEEAHGIIQYAEGMAENLQAVKVSCTILSDLEVTVDRLNGAKVVVLPYNPRLPDAAAEELRRYAKAGGKLLFFYLIPAQLKPILPVSGGTHVKASHSGHFSAIRVLDNALPGAPAVTGQRSWNIHAANPLPGQSQVLAEWLDDQGQPTGHAAVLGSSNALFVSHVLLNDDLKNKQRLLLAMAGYLVPELWQQAARNTLADIGRFGRFNSFEEAAAQTDAANPDNTLVRSALAAARALRESAREDAAEGRYAGALDQAIAAGEKIKEAFCLAQKPLAGEFRAFWCHDAFGVRGLSWDDAIRRLAENGFTAILPNMLWGGAAFYDSKVLPVATAAAERGDQVSACLDACRKHGLQIHVWKVNWYLGHAAPPQFVERMRRAARLQASADGQETLWLCPSHPDNRQLEIDSMVELARAYPVDGLHFDYIRYPDANHCFCTGCRERFQRAAGVEIRRWPGDVLANGPCRPAWLDWRRANITAVVRAVSEQARAIRPKIQLSAAVFRNWPRDQDLVGQDWKLWCDRGYLDFVCPMDYTPSDGLFENMVTHQRQWAGATPCYPGIGASASSSLLGPERVIGQILITRHHQTGGFVIFNYGATEARELLPMLGLGITAP